MKKSESNNLVEVYEVEPRKGRPGYSFKSGALEFLPADGPLPQVGDIILLPRNVSGDNEEQAYVMGMVAPFRVVEREYLYYREPKETHDPIDTKPARYLKTWIFVRRISKDEYKRDPGT
ncbi:hypothetical protein WME90_12255 [Sorangium sp. So ce375]|uniref:hypothetical protein n=1 Tax=Sorangium sp. So ce375 TaxID=3133306 RepID=UPI003F5BE522